jgi:predicted nucleic acid-binding protein
MLKSSSSFLFPDVNVWLALSCERHLHYPAARTWFEQLEDSARACFCRLTQIGLLRLLTTDAVMGEDEVLSQVGLGESMIGGSKMIVFFFPRRASQSKTAFSRVFSPATRRAQRLVRLISMRICRDRRALSCDVRPRPQHEVRGFDYSWALSRSS